MRLSNRLVKVAESVSGFLDPLEESKLRMQANSLIYDIGNSLKDFLKQKASKKDLDLSSLSNAIKNIKLLLVILDKISEYGLERDYRSYLGGLVDAEYLLSGALGDLNDIKDNVRIQGNKAFDKAGKVLSQIKRVGV